MKRRTKYVWLGVMGVVVAVCIGVSVWVFIQSRQQQESTPLTPVPLSLISQKESDEDGWPKVPVFERDPNYKPIRPSWLKADLTEVEPIPGKVAYLTFDDGPSSMTPEVLDVLRKKGATATFFVVYNGDRGMWRYYKEVVDSGCELALHAYEHNLPKIYQSPSTYMADYNKMNDFLYQTARIRTKQVRFPGGSSQTTTNRAVFWQVMRIALEEGLTWHDWNVSSGDASPNRHTAEWIYNNIFPAALQFDNPVILMHDVPRNTYTLEALPWIIDTLRAHGYRLDVISNLDEPVQHRNPNRDTPPSGGSSGGSWSSSGASSSSASSEASVSSESQSSLSSSSVSSSSSSSSSSPSQTSSSESSSSSSGSSESSSSESESVPEGGDSP